MKVAREERGVGVLVGADSGAGGAYGSASANAGFGVLHAFDTAGMDAPAPGSNFYPNAWIHSEASIGYVDGFAVTTTETVRVTSAIRGGYVGVAQADVSNSGRLFFDPLAPGAPLTFLSGHSYVPEPETSTTLLAGLGCLGWMARHRRSWDGRKIHPPECSRHLDRSPGVPSRPGLLARALWFHEATYDTKTTDGEGQGAHQEPSGYRKRPIAPRGCESWASSCFHTTKCEKLPLRTRSGSRFSRVAIRRLQTPHIGIVTPWSAISCQPIGWGDDSTVPILPMGSCRRPARERLCDARRPREVGGL
jgi:hypothetical protein